MGATSQKLPDDLTLGVRACRYGNWWEGLHRLTRLAAEDRTGRLPGFFYTYLGLAMARCQGRKREGLRLCLHGARLQPFLPENHLNAAWAYLLLRRRRSVLRCLQRAEAIDPDHPQALEIRRLLGVRRRPPLPFLGRSSLPNRVLGRLTWWGRGRWQELRPRSEPDGSAEQGAPRGG